MQTAQVCSRWDLKIAMGCGRVHLVSFDVEAGHSANKVVMLPAALPNKKNLQM